VSAFDPNVAAFEFKDATDLAAATTPHMVGVKSIRNTTLKDWSFLAKGQTSVRRFDLRRKQ
jgi:hypothetical protein